MPVLRSGSSLVVPWLLAAGLVVVVAGSRPARGEDWPQWRGPRGDGSSSASDAPVRWSRTENVTWKAPVPGVGHSSPIVLGKQVFLTTCDEMTQTRQLASFDVESGSRLWLVNVCESPLEHKHKLNSHASSTPAADGEHVYSAFLDRNEMLVTAHGHDGRLVWSVRPGPFSSTHGFCSNPVLYEDLVIVNGDHDGDSYLVALDRATGRTVWKTPRENRTRSYCTPIIRRMAGRTQMILSGDKCVASYEPRTGRRHWLMRGPTEQFVASMVDDGELLYLTAGFPERHILALRPDGSGEVEAEKIVWRTTENTSYVPSPAVVGPHFFVVSDNGIASAYEGRTGRRLWKQRLGLHYSASLVTAGGLVYFTSDEGLTTVVRPGEKYEAVAENDLGEEVFASPAIAGGRLFIRGVKHLYCIQNGAKAAE